MSAFSDFGVPGLILCRPIDAYLIAKAADRDDLKLGPGAKLGTAEEYRKSGMRMTLFYWPRAEGPQREYWKAVSRCWKGS